VQCYVSAIAAPDRDLRSA